MRTREANRAQKVIDTLEPHVREQVLMLKTRGQDARRAFFGSGDTWDVLKLGLAEKGPFSGVLQLSPLGSDVAALLQAPSDAD